MSNGILKVTLIVAGNRHNGAGTIAGQHEITDKYRHLFAIHGIDSVNTLQRATGLTLVHIGTVHIGLFHRFVYVGLNLLTVLHTVQ